MAFADRYLQLHALVESGDIAPDLGEWLLRELVAKASHADVTAVRDYWICRAASLCHGSTWAIAGTLALEVRKMYRWQSMSPVRKMLVEAKAVSSPLSESQQTIWRILSSNTGTLDLLPECPQDES